jgi:predicted DNA-binding protein
MHVCVIVYLKKGVKMSTHRLNIDFPAEEYAYLKMLCAHKGVSMKDFIVPILLSAIEEQEDALLAQKAMIRMKNMDSSDLIPIDQAFDEAGWNV